MANRKEWGFSDLLLDDGNIIRIKYNIQYEDDFFEDMKDHQAQNQYWSVGIMNDASATWNGIYISEINMKRVVAVL